MFDNDFRAWRNGAVCVELYDACCGKFIIHPEDICGNTDAFDANQIENMGIVLDGYANKEPYWLREQMTHEAPWINTELGCIISKESMGEYYGSL